MKNSFKKNPALYIGLALPLLMIVVLAGIPFIYSFVVPAPQYNFIYSINNNYPPNEKLKVVNGKLVLQAHNDWDQSKEPRGMIYLIDVHSKKSTKLNYLPLFKAENILIPPHESREYVIEGVSLKALDPSNISPDGYQVITGNNDNFFSLMFFFGDSRRNYLSLKKSGRIDNIPVPAQSYNGKFEGWVIPK